MSEPIKLDISTEDYIEGMKEYSRERESSESKEKRIAFVKDKTNGKR